MFPRRRGLIVAQGRATLAGARLSKPLSQIATLLKSNEEIERCVFAIFRVTESMGFKGDFANGRTFCGLESDHGVRPALRHPSTPIGP